MSKLLISGRHLLYSSSLARRIGRSEATFLQQSYYWMTVRGGQTINGVKWFWKTYEAWSEELGLSISTVRRAVRKLKKLGLISVKKMCASIWWQVSWYTVNIEAVNAFIQNEHTTELNGDTSSRSNWTDDIKDSSTEEFSTQQQAAARRNLIKRFIQTDDIKDSSTEEFSTQQYAAAARNFVDTFIQNEHMEDVNCDTLSRSNWTDDIKDSSTEEFSTQQHAAARRNFVEEDSKTLPKDVTTIEQTIETRSPSNVEQSTILRFVEEQNHSCESTQPLTHSDTLSAPASEPVEKPPQEDVGEICNQLRQIPCATAFRLNQEIIAVINKFWRNVPGALAYLKEALRTWKRVDSPEAVFVAACKNGRKPENWGKPLPNYPQPSDEDLAQLAEAKSTKRIKDYYRQPDGLWVVDTGMGCVSVVTYLLRRREL
ncbi:MAG: helix-turn-helix domain-containing protein [Brasilonema angustatum HA4187-MV1]|jgi:hypothetical protein|nr:helix-turn-helix domain-containing protein [Brasilonema angustatum HA4187-MV1]